MSCEVTTSGDRRGIRHRRGLMATAEQIQVVLGRLADMLACGQCGTRLRFGDYEGPHCGADLEDILRQWAQRLIKELRVEKG